MQDNFKFRDATYRWMKPLGYEIIWANNHPELNKDEVHYPMKKCRVVCVKDGFEEYFYLIHEFPFKGVYYALKTRKYKIGGDLDKPYEELKALIDALPNNIKKLPFIGKLKLLFTK